MFITLTPCDKSLDEVERFSRRDVVTVDYFSWPIWSGEDSVTTDNIAIDVVGELREKIKKN